MLSVYRSRNLYTLHIELRGDDLALHAEVNANQWHHRMATPTPGVWSVSTIRALTACASIEEYHRETYAPPGRASRNLTQRNSISGSPYRFN